MRRDAQKDKTKATILATALRLFAIHGYASTSTKRIAGAAGVSEGLIFHHFGAKRGLLEAAIQSQASLATSFRSVLNARPDMSVEQGLLALGEAFLTAVHSNDEFVAMVFGESRTDPELREMVRATVSETIDVIAGFITHRLESGDSASVEDPRVSADLFLTSLVGLIMTMHPERRVSEEAFIHSLVETITRTKETR